VALNTRLSVRARLLWIVLLSHTNWQRNFVWLSGSTVERTLGCRRAAREVAERELVRAGLLKIEQEHDERGRFKRRIYAVLLPKPHADARKTNTGDSADA